MCRNCHGELGKHRTVWCSKKCQLEFYRKTYEEQNPHRRAKLPPTSVGALHELVVAVDLLKKGYAVFRSLSPACSCDLAILKEKRLLRVEVKTGYYALTQNHQRRLRTCADRGNPEQYDGLAIVTGEEIIYTGLPVF